MCPVILYRLRNSESSSLSIDKMTKFLIPPVMRCDDVNQVKPQEKIYKNFSALNASRVICSKHKMSVPHKPHNLFAYGKKSAKKRERDKTHLVFEHNKIRGEYAVDNVVCLGVQKMVFLNRYGDV